MSVCLFVCMLQYYFWANKDTTMCYISIDSYAIRLGIFLKSAMSDQLSGRYWPESGHDWKKPAKNSLFLEDLTPFPIQYSFKILNVGR